jgi:signal transduction histidine kinase
MQNRSDLAAKLGMAVGIVDNLAAMRTGDADPDGYGDLLSRGLAKENDDGSVTMSKEGRALVKALNAGDIDAAKQAIADGSAAAAEAAKPKKAAAGGKKPKGTSGGDDSRQVQENIDKIVPELPLSGEQFQGAFDFYESGAEPPAGELAELAQLGLLEITPDGIGKATAAGAALVRAVKNGDARAAKDACTAGSEDVENTLAAADSREENAVLSAERATQVEQEAQAKAMTNATRANALQERLNAAEQAATQAEQSERILDASLAAAQMDLDAAREMEDNAPDAISKARYTREREAKERALTGLQERLDRARDLLDRKLDLASSLGSQISDLDAATTTLLSNASEQAARWREQAEALQTQTEELRTSVGNASRKALGGLAGAFKKLLTGNRRSKAHGKPSRFKIADIAVTDADVDAAVARWEADGLPPGLLDGSVKEQ